MYITFQIPSVVPATLKPNFLTTTPPSPLDLYFTIMVKIAGLSAKICSQCDKNTTNPFIPLVTLTRIFSQPCYYSRSTEVMLFILDLFVTWNEDAIYTDTPTRTNSSKICVLVLEVYWFYSHSSSLSQSVVRAMYYNFTRLQKGSCFEYARQS